MDLVLTFLADAHKGNDLNFFVKVGMGVVTIVSVIALIAVIGKPAEYLEEKTGITSGCFLCLELFLGVALFLLVFIVIARSCSDNIWW